MTPSESVFAKAEVIFDQIIDLPAADRTGRLAELCAGDPNLLAQVRSLLAAAEDDSTFMLEPALGEVQFQADATPTELGEFRILGLLGEGGMGTVYKAEQRHPRREVALKVIRAGMASRQMLRRFELEAETLAQLRHPGIAQIFAAGRFAAGGLAGQSAQQPYFAMEFIAGKPLDEFAAPLDSAGKLELVARVADAVAHAHQQGIIHRDLKPGNILVDATGQPKVLDFGVARITHREGEAMVTEASVATATGQVVGTLAYMSPEQLTGGQIDTRSDVYALGVILYQLLCGRLPHNVASLTVYEATRTILASQPVRPGTINPLLRGDIETIVAKAMAKQIAARYGSAAEFAADVRRYLAHEPILARPASATYQLRMFAKRNRLLVTSGALVALVVVGAAVGMTLLYFQANLQRQRAEVAGEAEREARKQAQREVRRTETVTDFIVRDTFAAANPSRRGHTVKLVDVLDDAVINAKEKFAGEPDIAVLTLNLLTEALTNAGRFEGAKAASTEASQLVAANPALPERLRYSTLRMSGLIYARTGELNRAEAKFREAVGSAQTAGLDTTEVLSCRSFLAECVQKQGRHEEAQQMLREMLRADALRPGRAMSVPAAETVLALSNSLGASLLSQQKQDEALEVLEQGLASVKDVLPATSPGVITTMGNLIVGKVSQKKGPEVLELGNELLDRAEMLWPPGHLNRAAAKTTVAMAYLQAGDWQRQMSLLREALTEMIDRPPLPNDYAFERIAGDLAMAAVTNKDLATLRFAGAHWMIGRLALVGGDELQSVPARAGELIGRIRRLDPGLNVTEYFAELEKDALRRAAQTPARHRRVTIVLALMMAETRNIARAQELLDMARSMPIAPGAPSDDDKVLLIVADAISGMTEPK